MFFYTNNFTEQEVDRLIDCLKSLGITSATKRTERPRKDGSKSFIIRVGKMEEELIIAENIRKYVSDCMKYKIRLLD